MLASLVAKLRVLCKFFFLLFFLNSFLLFFFVGVLARLEKQPWMDEIALFGVVGWFFWFVWFVWFVSGFCVALHRYVCSILVFLFFFSFFSF